MFHWVTGIPFENDLHGGAYDDLTLWEQIDDGAQYTPAKKWLFCVPIALWVSRFLWAEPDAHSIKRRALSHANDGGFRRPSMGKWDWHHHF